MVTWVTAARGAWNSGVRAWCRIHVLTIKLAVDVGHPSILLMQPSLQMYTYTYMMYGLWFNGPKP